MTETELHDFIDQYEEYLPKLIRDKIPELIKTNENKTARTRRLDTDEFVKYAVRKLLEESGEMIEHNDDEELKRDLADIIELVEEIILAKNFSKDEIEKLRDEKRNRVGGFSKRLLFLGKK